MEITASQVKELRDKTGAGIMDCKSALTDADGDLEQAIVLLRERGIAGAAQREGRPTAEGVVATYVHSDKKLGVLVEVNCETDFVANTAEFQEFAKEVAMQIAARGPRYVSKEDVPEEVLEKERGILREQAKREGKPEQIVEKMVEGRLRKFYEETCLLEQPYIRDEKGKRRIRDLLDDVRTRCGENVVVRRFARFRVGQEA
ncbi:MAG: translation elongation factor Ts [Armatimonadota bacterium]